MGGVGVVVVFVVKGKNYWVRKKKKRGGGGLEGCFIGGGREVVSRLKCCQEGSERASGSLVGWLLFGFLTPGSYSDYVSACIFRRFAGADLVSSQALYALVL